MIHMLFFGPRFLNTISDTRASDPRTPVDVGRRRARRRAGKPLFSHGDPPPQASAAQHVSSSGEQSGRQQQVDGEDGEERHALGGPTGVAERATRMVHEWAAIAEHESNNNETGSCNSACGTRRPAAQAEHSSGEGSWIELESTPATCR